MLSEREVVFLLDVDNTLLDNDRFAADLRARLEQAFGTDQSDRGPPHGDAHPVGHGDQRLGHVGQLSPVLLAHVAPQLVGYGVTVGRRGVGSVNGDERRRAWR